MAEIDVLKAQLVRTDENVHWGFRLQGGAEFERPITILSVRPGSPADKIGLRPGDEVTEIGDTPTQNVTSKEAIDIIQEYGLSLILTIERRARGAIPTNPVVSAQGSTPDLKHYQPYDLSGAQPAPRHPPHNREIQTVSARPYDPPPKPYPHPGGAPPPPQNDYISSQPHQNNYPPDEEDAMAPAGHQSKTFKMLASIMQNEEPYAGSSGLPPPRSATMERARAAHATEQAQNPARVKVFMPQQYNTPLGMYSAENIVDSFQGQAEAQLEKSYEQSQRMNSPPGMSAAQQAVLEQDTTAASDL